jgi:hypothetical protein
MIHFCSSLHLQRRWLDGGHGIPGASAAALTLEKGRAQLVVVKEKNPEAVIITAIKGVGCKFGILLWLLWLLLLVVWIAFSLNQTLKSYATAPVTAILRGAPTPPPPPFFFLLLLFIIISSSSLFGQVLPVASVHSLGVGPPPPWLLSRPSWVCGGGNRDHLCDVGNVW